MAFDNAPDTDNATPPVAPDSSQQMVSPTPQAAPGAQAQPQSAPQTRSLSNQRSPPWSHLRSPRPETNSSTDLSAACSAEFLRAWLALQQLNIRLTPLAAWSPIRISLRILAALNFAESVRTRLPGLAAGSQVPQQKSGLASALAGLGAGAGAQTQNAQQLDDKAKKEARENEEATEQKMLRMHDIAKGNALLLSTYLEMNRTAQDHDPIRKQHMDWAQSAEANGAPVKYMSESELAAARQADPATIGKYQVLNLGVEPLKDNDGNVVVGTDGKPKMEGRFALIDGLHDGNMDLPASMVSDLQKYGKYAGVTGEDDLKAGQSVSMQHYIQLANAIREGRKQELAGLGSSGRWVRRTGRQNSGSD